MSPWATLAGALVKLLTWLGTIFLIRKGAKDAVKLDQAEKSLETIKRVNAPVSVDESERLWARNHERFGRVRDDPRA